MNQKVIKWTKEGAFLLLLWRAISILMSFWSHRLFTGVISKAATPLTCYVLRQHVISDHMILSIVLLAGKNGVPNFDSEASFRKTHVTLSTRILLF